MTREELIERVAHVSHQTWMRQAKGPALDPRPDPEDPTPTVHDFERAEDIVAELERLGIIRFDTG